MSKNQTDWIVLHWALDVCPVSSQFGPSANVADFSGSWAATLWRASSKNKINSWWDRWTWGYQEEKRYHLPTWSVEELPGGALRGWRRDWGAQSVGRAVGYCGEGQTLKAKIRSDQREWRKWERGIMEGGGVQKQGKEGIDASIWILGQRGKLTEGWVVLTISLLVIVGAKQLYSPTVKSLAPSSADRN